MGLIIGKILRIFFLFFCYLLGDGGDIVFVEFGRD